MEQEDKLVLASIDYITQFIDLSLGKKNTIQAL